MTIDVVKSVKLEVKSFGSFSRLARKTLLNNFINF